MKKILAAQYVRQAPLLEICDYVGIALPWVS